MKCYIEERTIELAKYIIENKCTVRDAAKKFGISKSTVHKDITQTLKRVNPPLYAQVKTILDINKNERHLRGGEATKQKYLAKANAQTNGYMPEKEAKEKLCIKAEEATAGSN